MKRNADRSREWMALCRGVLLGVLVGALGVSHATDVNAQATPAPSARDVPAPEECQIAPRPFPLFPAGVGQRAAATPAPVATPPAPPFTPPAGDPADTETVAAVTATVREALACRNAGEPLRAYSLFTQDMIVALYGGPATIDPELRRAVVEGPTPIPRARRLAIVAIDDVVILPDGRTGAVVATETARRTFRDYLIFEQDPASGRWLIDESVPLA
nr:hypothetical protein [Chloroflexia bacterium]